MAGWLCSTCGDDDSSSTGDMDSGPFRDASSRDMPIQEPDDEPDATDDLVADLLQETTDDTNPGDVVVDGEIIEDVDPACDQDEDGVLGAQCGGEDCDDLNPSRSPDLPELCDDLDNNCNDVLNDGIECLIYAHSGDYLYRLDPFHYTATEVTEVPYLFDIDTEPVTGWLYGITEDALYRFDDARNTWFIVGPFPELEDPTGLAIDSDGVGWVTSADSVYTVDLDTGDTDLVGVVGSDFYSSGDCVINKYDSLFMTSKAFDEDDILVLIDRTTGEGTAIGSTGYRNIFGLVAAWGQLYGLTSLGELITLDRDTGEGQWLHTFDITWYGAASSPGR